MDASLVVLLVYLAVTTAILIVLDLRRSEAQVDTEAPVAAACSLSTLPP